MNINFYNLDDEIESYFGTSIERLQKKFKNMLSYRKETSKALIHILNQHDSLNSVIALTPSGLLNGYLQPIKKSNGIIVAITDKPENILERIVFYDIDSKPFQNVLTDDKKLRYLESIKEDIAYFGKSFKHSHIKVCISRLNVDESALKIQKSIDEFIDSSIDNAST